MVFWSDNGGMSFTTGRNRPATSNSRLREGKGYLYEGGIRVPLIVRWPAGQARQRVRCAGCSVDLYPTILAMAGGKLPPNQAIDGESLLPLLNRTGEMGQTCEWKREALYWHYPHYSDQGSGTPGRFGRGTSS